MNTSIYDHSDYRGFLKDRYRALKAAEKTHSISILARTIGCSTSFIKKLFAGKVHLGYRFVEPLSIYLKLSAAEERYLFLTVAYHASEGQKVRALLGELLSRMKEETPLSLPEVFMEVRSMS